MKFDFIRENLSLFVRNSEIGHLFEIFLLSAVSSILFIRFFLTITSFPQLSGSGLHIAHVLWGGLFMAVALLVSLAFLNKEANEVSAVIGGIGFGTFIDELGKFITSDNNYFYRPSIALIYVIFIALFLMYRALERQRCLTRKEYTLNALEQLKEVVAQDFDEHEKRKLLVFLEKSDEEDELIIELKKLVAKIDAMPVGEPSFAQRVKKIVKKTYTFIVDQAWFDWSLVSFFVIFTLAGFLKAFYLAPNITRFSFVEKGEVLFSVISGILVVIGIFLLPKSRLQAYAMLKRAVLVSIFLGQFFTFFEDQLSALVGLAFSLIVLTVVQYMIEEERLNIRESR